MEPSEKGKDKAGKDKKGGKEKAAPPTIIELPEGFGWSHCHFVHSQTVLKGWAHAAMYILNANVGPGATGLRLVENESARSAYAPQPYQAGALKLFPFGDKIQMHKGAAPLASRVDFVVKVHGKTQTFQFWIIGFDKIGGQPTAEPPVLPAISPFWWLQKAKCPADFTGPVHKLTYEKKELEVPMTLGSLNSSRKPSATLSCTMIFYMLTNKEPIPESACLQLEDVPDRSWVHVL